MERLPGKPVEGTPFQQVGETTPALRQSFLQMEAELLDILEAELLERLRLRSAENNDCNYGQSFQYVALDEQLTEREKLALELIDQIMAYHRKLPE